ncbi:DUF2884 family protein [Thermomonas sp. HDW16]|uniref:DUF2884 family protein n=1 Tax=Thermomonas sp. HDW16 TaxID=2714945 RepID=UPI0014096940|nr:DUF2884 family protein [Thermomonas sp. HDW16]QIL20713.1 YggN family protein [Thermomonas sp. HDW16]
MKQIHSLALALFVSAPLLACSEPPAPPAPPAAPAPPVAMQDSPKGFIGRQVEKAISQAREELRTQNISISDGININVNGHEIKRNEGLPKAEITPQGDLLIEGKTVAITAEQRQQLLTYRGQITGIAEAGMAIGVQGADIAGEALSGAVGAIFGGKDSEKEFEQRMQAQGNKIEAEAVKLCAYLPAMLSQQQALAAALPAFKPYANMTQADIEDCGKKGKNNGVAVTSS